MILALAVFLFFLYVVYRVMRIKEKYAEEDRLCVNCGEFFCGRGFISPDDKDLRTCSAACLMSIYDRKCDKEDQNGDK